MVVRPTQESVFVGGTRGVLRRYSGGGVGSKKRKEKANKKISGWRGGGKKRWVLFVQDSNRVEKGTTSGWGKPRTPRSGGVDKGGQQPGKTFVTEAFNWGQSTKAGEGENAENRAGRG